MADLLEVFSVLVFSNQNGNSSSISDGKLYGAIIGNDFRGSYLFFKEKGGSPDDCILPDGTLSLTGPHRSNRGDEWLLRLKLYLKKGHEVLELCNGFLGISPLSYHLYLNKYQSGVVRGRDGYAVVNFVTLTSAVQATVEVSVVDNVGPAFYGHIRARNEFQRYRNAYDRKYFQTTLFSASQDDPCYSEGTKIPLSRCVTTVQYSQPPLLIETQLFEAMSHNPVAFGDISFEVEKCGNETRTIGGIQVKVTWAEHTCYF